MKLDCPVERDFSHILPLKKSCSSKLCLSHQLICTRAQTTCADRRNNKSASVDSPLERAAPHPAPSLFVLCICCPRIQTPADRTTLWALYLTEAASRVLCVSLFFFFLFPRVLATNRIIILDKNRICKNRKRVSLAMLQYERFRGPFKMFSVVCMVFVLILSLYYAQYGEIFSDMAATTWSFTHMWSCSLCSVLIACIGCRVFDLI